jgi:DNA methyltransferase 1-associated protein 1
MDEQGKSPDVVCWPYRSSFVSTNKSKRRLIPFTNAARTDGLILGHWQRQQDAGNKAPPLSGVERDINGKQEGEVPNSTESEMYHFAKYNIKAQVPKRYTDEQYNRHLRNDDWTREETDYLMDLVEEYDLRWVVVADRYDYQPRSSDTEPSGAELVSAKWYRTMEQMKARYYTVAATILALEHPLSEMSEAEFDLHEKMVKFDPERERVRKELAALQLNRTADEVREEGILLEELKRMVVNEQAFIAERKELYARLEVPISVGNSSMYQSSQGLSQLLQTLLQVDKSKKRRSLLGAEGAVGSPASQIPSQNIPSGVRDSRPDTPTASTKKAAAATTGAQHAVKNLTPAEEAKYGVQHHDRLAPGVQFRNDRAQKLTQAKSNVQTQKLAAALAELEVPLRLVMPTDRVCKEFEKLIHSVNLLLDARKVAEKVESEIRVLEAAKEERERKDKEVKPISDATARMDVKMEVDDYHRRRLSTSSSRAVDKGDDLEDSEDAPGEEADADDADADEDDAEADSDSDADVDPDAEFDAEDDDITHGPSRNNTNVPKGVSVPCTVRDSSSSVSARKRSASVLSTISDKSGIKRLRK